MTASEPSIAPDPSSAPSAPPPPPSWRRDPPARADPPEGAAYGYVLADGPHPCSREELLEWVRAYPGTPAVWTPETEGAVRPEEAPFLVEGLRSRRREEAQQRAGLATLAVLGVAGALVLLRVRPGPGMLLLAALAGFWFLDSLYALRLAGRVDAGTFAQQRQNERHAAWTYSRPAPLTRLLAGALLLVFLAEGFAYERAVAAAGLVKEAVYAGEAWRLLTGPLLHGGVLHLGMNLAALLVLGRFVEAHAPRWRLPLVFLASALAGSALSLLLSPAASVGASGGILGLVGFLGVRARLRPAEFPDDFLHRIRYAIGATAVLGLLGFAFVDNWAHLGGLLGGAALGWLPDEGPERDHAWAGPAGRVSLGVVLAACAWAAARLLGLG